MAYRLCLGVELPALAEGYETRADRDAIAAIIAGERSRWAEIPVGQERGFDLILMSLGGAPQHVGVVVEPGRILHIAPDSYSLIESYRQTRLRNRVVGFFRYAP